VLWDVDFTLIDARGSGLRLYELVLADQYGLPLPAGLPTFGGRTDLAISIEVLRLAGIADPEREAVPFQAAVAARVDEINPYIRERGRVLPGAAEAIAALAAMSRQDHSLVIQSLLTGNIPAVAAAKIGALGLTEHLDLSIGAYGDHSSIRADLVPVAQQKATARYGGDFAGHATVLIGDTPDDIGAARAHGARSVGVASGSYTAAELAAAGADAVLPSLAGTARTVAAIVG
jgi:phosphoglycolate phosphatase-like HAD superfamily hydrolase